MTTRDKLWTAVVAAAFLSGLFLFGYKQVHTAPDNAPAILDLDAQTYASPPCVIDGSIERELIKNRADARDPSTNLVLEDYAKLSTMEEARLRRGNRNWKADKACSRAEGFTQTLSGFDLLFGHTSRWTKDGDWRW